MLPSGTCYRNPSICPQSVTSLHPTQPVEIFRNDSTPYRTLASSHLLTSKQNITEIVPGEPIPRELNARGLAKYSNVGHIEGYISEMVQGTASGTINDW